MPTSGTTNFTVDILDLAQEAAERAGVDFTSGQSLRSASLALDLMSLEWANEGIHLWLIDTQSQALTGGTSNYTIPADTIDVIYPMLRSTANGITTDYSLSRIDVTSYAAIPNKAYTGRPTQILINRTETPSVTLWPVPADNTHTLVYYRMRRVQDAGIATNQVDIPIRFIPAMVAGLAYRFSMKSSNPMVLQKVPLLKAEYREALDMAQYADRDRSSTYITPLVY